MKQVINSIITFTFGGIDGPYNGVSRFLFHNFEIYKMDNMDIDI